ncbi:virulence-associated E family protein [Mesorhizobium denitrificans]|uniref:Virulence-associated protein E-like domain-containing protein n=1 Tax=Mesorhizobium denitrificans TaxID=2294114 RepID=A0A371XDT2_9HYPH|nr:virulence-associated E family protein [Mesorhizobium denitrificans]RFC67381.1 hypothetical protein DY251_12650 [Mesorhizobium denitrificans]
MFTPEIRQSFGDADHALSISDNLTVLTDVRGRTLSKRHAFQSDGTWQSADIPKVKYFKVRTVTVSSIRDLFRELPNISANGCDAIIRGEPNAKTLASLAKEESTRRTGECFDPVRHPWACIDIDKIEVPGMDICANPDAVIAHTIRTHFPEEFQNVKAVWQLSSSAGVKRRDLVKAHIWFWLDRPLSGLELKAWHKLSGFPADTSLFGDVQLHYLANPTFNGASDPCSQRWGMLDGEHDSIHVPDIDMIALETARREAIDYADKDPAMPPELALEALNCIPNTEKTLPTREDFLALLCSVKVAFGREAQNYRDQIEEWALRHGWADAEYFEHFWTDESAPRTPHDYLISLARKHGWKGGAVLDFKEISDDEMEFIEANSGGALELFAPEHPKPNVATAIDIITRYLPDHFKYDEMRGLVMLALPLEGERTFKPRPIEDNDYVILQEAMQRGGVHGKATATVRDAVGRVARLNRFHPIRDYLNGLPQWDGKNRLTTFYSRYFGAEDNEYTRGIGPLLPLTLVARVMEPGCKADYMVVLESEQGDGKSTMCRILAGDFFSDTMPKDLAHKDAMIHLKGKWLVEMAEMAPLRKADADVLKSFITAPIDIYRPIKAREEVHQPRQVVFIGTTNNAEYLRDPTGARRFWPVATGDLDPDGLREDRDQIFAEAVVRYKRGDKWWPDREFEARVIKPEQDARYTADIWEEHITKFLADKNETKVVEIAQTVLGKSLKELGNSDTLRVTGILTRLGFIRVRASSGNIWRRRVPVKCTGAGDGWDS